MSDLIIAAGKLTLDRLHNANKLDAIQKSFNATRVTLCQTVDDLNKVDPSSSSLLFYSDFPESYNNVRSRLQNKIKDNNIVRLEYDSDKLWVFDDKLVANCIDAKEEAPAINRALKVPRVVNTVGQVVAVAVLALCLTATIAYSRCLIADADTAVTQQTSEETSKL